MMALADLRHLRNHRFFYTADIHDNAARLHLIDVLQNKLYRNLREQRYNQEIKLSKIVQFPVDAVIRKGGFHGFSVDVQSIDGTLGVLFNRLCQ